MTKISRVERISFAEKARAHHSLLDVDMECRVAQGELLLLDASRQKRLSMKLNNLTAVKRHPDCLQIIPDNFTSAHNEILEISAEKETIERLEREISASRSRSPLAFEAHTNSRALPGFRLADSFAFAKKFLFVFCLLHFVTEICSHFRNKDIFIFSNMVR